MIEEIGVLSKWGVNKSGVWCLELYRRFFAEGCSDLAASLAYSTLLSLVPLLVVTGWVLALFPAFQGVGETLRQFVLDNFIATSANVISTQLNTFLRQVQSLSWWNLVALGAVSLLMIYNLVHAVNRIWQVQMERHIALSFMIYLLVLICAPVVFGVLLLSSAYLSSAVFIQHTVDVHYVKRVVLLLLPYGAALVTFTVLNWVVPSCRVRFLPALVAGGLTTIFFELAKYVFTLYFQYFPTYRLLYGALATIPIFLIWIYVSWLIILLGVLVCHMLSKPRSDLS